MKNKSVQLLLILIFTVAAVGLFFLLDSRKNYNQRQHLQLLTKQYPQAYNTIYSQHKMLATSLYTGIVEQFEIEPLYKKLITADEAEKNILRKDLTARIMPRYKTLRHTAKLRQLHFHLSDNESFLRMHRPEKFGDNLSDVRQTVAYVNREHAAIDGFEEGRIYNGYRFVFPITAVNKTHLGSVEISFGPEAFTSAMMEQHAVLSNFFIKKTIVAESVFADELKRNYKKSHHPGYYNDKNVLAELKKVSRQEMKEIKPCDRISKEINSRIQKEKAISTYDPCIDMVFTTIPVFHPLTKEMIAFFTVRSRSVFFAHEARHFKIVFGLCLLLLGMILTIFFLQYSKRRVVEGAMTLLQQERDMFIQGSVMTFTWQNSEDWPVTQISKNVIEITGYGAEEFLDGSVLYASLIHPDDLQRVKDEVRDNSIPESSGFIHEPYRLLNRNGETVWILDSTTLIRNSHGEISHYSGYLVDISKNMRAEQALEKSSNRMERYLTAIEDIGLGLFVVDPDYRIRDMNGTMIGWFGDQTGRICYESVAGRDSPCDSCCLKEVTEKSKVVKYMPAFVAGRTFDSIASPIANQDGGISKMEIIRDITGEEQAKTDLIEMNRQLEAAILAAREMAEKSDAANQAKSAFLSNMSHELRTPLNAILGYTQIFARDSMLTSQQQSGIKTMHQAGEHLLMLVDDILDLSKIEADKMELALTRFPLPEFLQDVMDIVRGKAIRKGLNIIYEPDSNLPITIEGDELRLRQVLLNLLTNAVKFTQHGQCVLRALSQSLAGNRVLLTFVVEDSGVGIAPEMLEKVFDPFQQTGDRLQYAEGSGLGLAISRKLAHVMGGELQLISPVNEQPTEGEGVGCRVIFTVEVGVAEGVVSNELEKDTVTGYTVAKGLRRKKILIVDDNPSNRSLQRAILKPLGFIIDEAEDGTEVEAACRRFAPDAILMDLRMPKMDGFTAGKQLMEQAEFSGIPIIAITASTAGQEKLRERCLEHGFSSYITKPYSLAELLQPLAEHLEIKLQYASEVTENIIQEEDLVIPPMEILEKLAKLSRIGDIDSIVVEAEKLAVMESGKYHLFSRRIKQMADDFQLMKLEGFITRRRDG